MTKRTGPGELYGAKNKESLGPYVETVTHGADGDSRDGRRERDAAHRAPENTRTCDTTSAGQQGMKRMKEGGSKRRESQVRAGDQTKKIIGGILKEEGNKMYKEREAGKKKEGEAATGNGEKEEGDDGKNIELRRLPEETKHNESSQPSDRRLPAHNDIQASGSGKRGPENLAKQPKYGELQEQREGEGVNGNGEKREGDGGKDMEHRRQPKGAKHNKNSQPSDRRCPTHNDAQASGSGEHGPESLAKQQKHGELQEKKEGEGNTDDDEKRESDNGKDSEHRRQPEGDEHGKSSQPSDRHSPAHNDVQASGSGERAPEGHAKQLRHSKQQEEHEQVARHEENSQPGDQSSPAHNHGQASGSKNLAPESHARQQKTAKRQEDSGIGSKNLAPESHARQQKTAKRQEDSGIGSNNGNTTPGRHKETARTNRKDEGTVNGGKRPVFARDHGEEYGGNIKTPTEGLNNPTRRQDKDHNRKSDKTHKTNKSRSTERQEEGHRDTNDNVPNNTTKQEGKGGKDRQEDDSCKDNEAREEQEEGHSGIDDNVPSNRPERPAKQQRLAKRREKQEQVAKHDGSNQGGNRHDPGHSYGQTKGSKNHSTEGHWPESRAKLQEERKQGDKHNVIVQDGGRSSHAHSDGQASGSGGVAPERPAEPQEEQEEQEQEAKHKAHGTVIKSEDLEDASSGQEDQSIAAHSHKQASGAGSRAEQPSRGERQKEKKTKDRHQNDDRGPREEDTGGGGLAQAKNLRAKRVARRERRARETPAAEGRGRRTAHHDGCDCHPIICDFYNG